MTTCPHTTDDSAEFLAEHPRLTCPRCFFAGKSLRRFAVDESRAVKTREKKAA